MTNDERKVCSRCDLSKLRSDYYADRSAPDGLRAYCKVCHSAVVKSGRSPDKRRAESQKRREKDPEAVRRYQRGWIAANPDKRLKRNRQFRKDHPEKDRAHNIVAKALKRGALVRPDACESCGAMVRIEAHHTDYSQPYLIQWLCPPCHAEADRARMQRMC